MLRGPGAGSSRDDSPLLAKRYRDGLGRWRTVPRAALASLHASVSGRRDTNEPGVRVVTRGRRAEIGGRAEVHTEDGRVIACSDELPRDLPLGYHLLVDLADDSRSSLIVAPPRCWLPEGLKAWGWAVQLYGARSRESWGIGDLADLRRVSAWAATQGARVVVINPLHAPRPGLPQQASPYFPSSRCFRNPLYLCIDEVPGAGRVEGVAELGAAARRLNGGRVIERDAVYRLKMDALERIWARQGERGDEGFESYRRARGATLENYATFVALAETLPSRRAVWPAELSHAGAPGVARWRRAHRDRVHFHEWLQWLLEVQLERAGRGAGIVGDLAVGVDPDGADTWMWPGAFLTGARVGAPPDRISPEGQDWGASAFDPEGLPRLGYAPFIETIRASLRATSGARIDHVMGLWRLFVIPAGFGADSGTYLGYPASDLLAIIALESHRAGAFVVGEDLGTVPARVRAAMARLRMLSYRIMWFEPGAPETYPELALAAATNHDLPTIAGVWTGADARDREAMGRTPDADALVAARAKLAQTSGVSDEAGIDEVVAGTYGSLARAPSSLVVATLEDALSVQERPNHPGTTDEWPNFSLALPVALEDVEADERPRNIARLLGER